MCIQGALALFLNKTANENAIDRRQFIEKASLTKCIRNNVQFPHSWLIFLCLYSKKAFFQRLRDYAEKLTRVLRDEELPDPKTSNFISKCTFCGLLSYCFDVLVK